MINHNRVKALPTVVRQFLYISNGWLVGSGAPYLIGTTDDIPKDWDIIVPFKYWNKTVFCLIENATVNSKGGVRIITDEVKLDMWPGELDWYFRQIPHFPAYAVNLCSCVCLTAEKGYTKKELCNGQKH